MVTVECVGYIMGESVLIPMHLKAQDVSVDAGPAGCGSNVKGSVPSCGVSVRLSLGVHGPEQSLPPSRCESAAVTSTPFPSACAQAEFAFFLLLSGCVFPGVCV